MICCVTGHRPKGFPFPYGDGNSVLYEIYRDRLYKAVREMIGEGCTTFISGMAQGVDLDFAEAVLYCREVDFGLENKIKLEAAIPYPNQAKGWPYEYWDRYQSILLECDQKTLLSNAYHTNCFQLRNEYMVDRADVVLAVWNGEKKGGHVEYDSICSKKRQADTLPVIKRTHGAGRSSPHSFLSFFKKFLSKKHPLQKNAETSCNSGGFVLQ